MSCLLCPTVLPLEFQPIFQCLFLPLRALKERVGLNVGSGVVRNSSSWPACGQGIGGAGKGALLSRLGPPAKLTDHDAH